MATSNISVSKTWTQLASTDDDQVLITFNGTEQIEFVTTAANSAPSASLNGHVLNRGEGVTRQVLGGGYVWARLNRSSHLDGLSVVVSK